jgi:hypothetical protein
MAAGLSCAVIARNKLLRNKRDQPWQTQRLFATFNHHRAVPRLLMVLRVVPLDEDGRLLERVRHFEPYLLDDRSPSRDP